MAQQSRNRTSGASFSDDPIEALASWFQMNGKPLMIGAGALAAAGIGIALYRSTAATSQARAAAALAEAQGILAQGQFAEAQGSLEKVVGRYGSTSSGRQAVLLLAQALFEQQKVDEGVKVLEKGLSGATGDDRSAIETLLAAGSEMKGDFAGAAAHYAKAAEATPYPVSKRNLQAFQARSLMSAGKSAEAKALWETLAGYEGESVAQEAAVRIGELAGK
jgi:predicted negative regulator of RcsB-dependent stress response